MFNYCVFGFDSILYVLIRLQIDWEQFHNFSYLIEIPYFILSENFSVFASGITGKITTRFVMLWKGINRSVF